MHEKSLPLSFVVNLILFHARLCLEHLGAREAVIQCKGTGLEPPTDSGSNFRSAG